MFTIAAVTVSLAIGFGFGRVKHPANLKLSAVKAEIAKIEAEAFSTKDNLLARLKALL